VLEVVQGGAVSEVADAAKQACDDHTKIEDDMAASLASLRGLALSAMEGGEISAWAKALVPASQGQGAAGPGASGGDA
jgi:hypothetical protein